MQTVVVNSWNELQDELFEGAWNPDIRRFRPRYAFRGLSDTGYPLETTLMRLGGDYATLEKHLLRAFIKYAHRTAIRPSSIWHWLSVAQHYGLPTRLLDWTYSPLIAAHFATANIEKAAVDGAIWAVHYVRTHQLLPEPLARQLAAEGANVFTVDMLSDTVASLQEWSQMVDHPLVMFFEPPSMDDRIVNQFALFSVMNNARALMDHWLDQHPQLFRKIIIPACLKWEIRDKLDQSNITERVLFPGLDGLSRWLKRNYSPAGKTAAGCAGTETHSDPKRSESDESTP